ncbi:UNVERIFIED_CONTAM: hypothetical protein Scaly_0346500 [Sesamum calycinum]|uniref:Uncharacterized protein n=1 Tax=Sesamum calycinum TaxID=2727403 RepID=A0AAW2SBU3_9LAMI
MKRVTDPLDDKVKARIVGRDRTDPGYVSSGSEHSAHADHDLASPSLSELFFGFSVDDSGESYPEGNDSDSDSGYAEKCDGLPAGYGYNAAICKTKWESSGGLTAGNYEFIDVLRKDSSTRYLVDLDFASEFEIARPTNSYDRLLECMPRVFVGKSEDLKQILKAMSDAAKRSLKSRGLHLPPWRKHRFMQNKWLGSYRRTGNVFPASLSSPCPANRSYTVECRTVGFDTAVNGGRLFVPATARTR